MFKIGDFSKLTQISVRMLRYYENKGILTPIKIDAESKYRWYSVTQIKQVNKIKVLRDLGFLVEDIKILLTLEEEDFIEAIQGKKQTIIQEINGQQQMLHKLDILEQALSNQKKVDLEYEVQIKEVPEKNILCYRQIIADYNDEGDLWRILGTFIEKQKIAVCDASAIAIFHDNEDIDVEVSYVVSNVGLDSFPFYYRVLAAEKLVASIFVYGSFDNIGQKYQDLAYWIDKNKYEVIGNVRELPINGPWNRKKEEEYLTELQIPIRKING